MIFVAPTALDLSFQLPTLPFWSCAVPTLFAGKLRRGVTRAAEGHEQSHERDDHRR